MASTRREFLKMSTAFAAGIATPAQASQNRNRRTLLKGGTIVSMDPKVGDFVKGDLLIQDKKIALVGMNLQASGAEVIDASDTILIPGFVDCHRHSWEGVLRRITGLTSRNQSVVRGKY